MLSANYTHYYSAKKADGAVAACAKDATTNPACVVAKTVGTQVLKEFFK